MTLCLVPQLRRLGWRFRLSFDPSHPAVKRGARVGVWALGYAGGYQAGLIVVLLLANRIEGGVAAYQWAYTFFYLPHALFGIPIFNVLFTAMSEHAARDEVTGAITRLREGLAMLAFILVPIAAGVIVTAEMVAQLTLRYGAMTTAGSELVGRVLQAFALGLPAFSAFLVYTRAFYALGDTKTPALLNAATVAIASATGAVFFTIASPGWEVPGLALGHSLGFVIGSAAMSRAFVRKAGSGGGTKAASAIVRSVAVGAGALAAMLAVGNVPAWSPSNSGTLLALIVTAAAGAFVYLGGMAALGSPELRRLRTFARRAR